MREFVKAIEEVVVSNTGVFVSGCEVVKVDEFNFVLFPFIAVYIQELFESY